MKETIRQLFLDAGASAVGFATAGEIDSDAHELYRKWIEEGYHGEMGYLQRHLSLRKHTDNVLKDAKTVISLAFGYNPGKRAENASGNIAAYAQVDDYHIVIREVVIPVIKELKEKLGGNWRLCIDSAPVAEHFWALKSGIGRRGINGSVIVNECGGFCFLAEVLTTLEIEPDNPSEAVCDECGVCVKKCPAGAIRGDGTIDAGKCINYITIEKKGQLNEEESQVLKKGSGFLLGCDICLRICPHNAGCSSDKSIFPFREEFRDISPERIMQMGEEEFKTLFHRSPLLYAGLDKLKRNAVVININKKG